MDEQQAAPEARKNDRMVEITVDGTPRQIEKGPYDLAEFKIFMNIDPTKDVDELIDGQFVPVTGDKKIHIKGGEVFISHVPQGGSS